MKVKVIDKFIITLMVRFVVCSLSLMPYIGWAGVADSSQGLVVWGGDSETSSYIDILPWRDDLGNEGGGVLVFSENHIFSGNQVRINLPLESLEKDIVKNPDTYIPSLWKTHLGNEKQKKQSVYINYLGFDNVLPLFPLQPVLQFEFLSFKESEFNQVRILTKGKVIETNEDSSLRGEDSDEVIVEESLADDGSSELVESGRYLGMRDSPFKDIMQLSGDLLSDSDPTSLMDIKYQGQQRVAEWGEWGQPIYAVYLVFLASFTDGLETEIRIPKSGLRRIHAKEQALKYATKIGKLPTQLRWNLKTLIIKDVNEMYGLPYKGGTIAQADPSTGKMIIYAPALERIDEKLHGNLLLHESAHLSIWFSDILHSKNEETDNWMAPSEDFRTRWEYAMEEDNYVSISEYAFSFFKCGPDIERWISEDIAESFVAYFAVRYRPNRITVEERDIIQRTIPHRIKLFDDQGYDLSHPSLD